MNFTILLFLTLRLKVVILIKTIIISVYIVFFEAVIVLLSSFNSNLFLGLGYNFIKFFNYYSILITHSTFSFSIT